jgi:hypothetical protein
LEDFKYIIGNGMKKLSGRTGHVLLAQASTVDLGSLGHGAACPARPPAQFVPSHSAGLMIMNPSLYSRNCHRNNRPP